MRGSIAATTLICAAAWLWAGAASADPKATWTKTCSNCHEHADFAGQPADKLAEKIKNISNGTIKHKKKITVTDEEATALAAFLSGGGK